MTRNTAFKITLLCLVALPGCKGGLSSRILGHENKTNSTAVKAFYVVSCCQDNDGANNLSWPSFLPQSHIDLCMRAARACYDNDCQINGDTYLPMHVDCGRTPYKIGDGYYPPSGY